MKLRSYQGEKLDMSTALWVSFWMTILTLGNPDLLDAIIAYIGRH